MSDELNLDENNHSDKLNPEGGSLGIDASNQINEKSFGGTNSIDKPEKRSSHKLQALRDGSELLRQKALARTRLALARLHGRDNAQFSDSKKREADISTVMPEPDFIQYVDKQIGLVIKGKDGEAFDFDKHKYSPTHLLGEAVITTESGDEYYMMTNATGTYLLDVQESTRQRKPVMKMIPEALPPMEFGKPWDIEGVSPINVDSIVLKYKIAGDIPLGTQIEEKSPFDAFKEMVISGIVSSDQRKKSIDRDTNSTPEVDNHTYHVSNNDVALVTALVNRTGREIFTDIFIGEKPEQERKNWDPEAQKYAQEGIVDLIKTELDGLEGISSVVDISRVKQYMKALYGDEANRKFVDYFESKGKKVDYQNLSTSEFDILQKTGDYLHFGVNVRPVDAPDLFKKLMRIYVPATASSSGHVAAEIIRRAREKGYEPYGKVWDESMSTRPIRERKDRLLFYPQTQSQQDIIMEALRDLQHEQPDLFETELPLLVEQTDIPGVGLSEDPIQRTDFKESFNQSREDPIREAWEMTRRAVTGKDDLDITTHPLDSRDLAIKDALKSGALSMDKVIEIFRRSVRQISPKYQISPDNFARNSE